MKDFKTLNQLIAVEKSEKKRITNEISEIHRASQVLDLFNGFERKYVPTNDGDETLPPESKKVQLNAKNCLDKVKKALTQELDLEATKDLSNSVAKAHLVVDGEILLENVPATTLLFLEKKLNDLHTIVEKFTVLDNAENWTLDVESNLYKTQVVKANRTKKTPKPIVLYDATDKHPAQCQIFNDDIVVGQYELTKTSGALPKLEKENLLEKISNLLNCVKAAREQANMCAVQKSEIGKTIFNFLGL